MNIFSPFVWILDIFQWTPFDSNPVDCFFKGLVGACGVSVLYNLMRVYNFIQACRDPDTQSGDRRRLSSSTNPLRRNWRAAVQFWCLTGVLSLVGCRVSSLIVLEFSLRAVSALAAARQARGRVQSCGAAPDPEPVLSGLQPHLHSGLHPPGGAAQLLRPAPGRCAQLGICELQQRSVAPCGQAVPAAQDRWLLREVHQPPNLWTHHAGLASQGGYLGLWRSGCGFHHHGLRALLIPEGRDEVLDSAHSLLHHVGGLQPRGTTSPEHHRDAAAHRGAATGRPAGSHAGSGKLDRRSPHPRRFSGRRSLSAAF